VSDVAVVSHAQPRGGDVPNYFDGPITMWAIVDRHGTPFACDTQVKAVELMERWEKTLAKFGPYRIIRLVEQRENA
jgi:hypothetical protein